MAQLKPAEELDPVVGRVMKGFDRCHGLNAPTLIGLAGCKGVGKDTAADHLVRNHGFVKIALADPLRDGLKAMLGLSDQRFDDRNLKEAQIDWLGASPRQLLQTLGTEWGRNYIARDLWLRVAARRIDALPPGAHVVVSDIRFEDEAAWVRKQGGQLWHIRRDIQASDPHSSEQGIALQPGDVEIFNTGSLAQLHAQLAAALKEARQ